MKPKYAYKFVVELEFNEEMGNDHVGYHTAHPYEHEAKKHIETAVKQWGGSSDPRDPFFPSNIKNVLVKRYVRRRK